MEKRVIHLLVVEDSSDDVELAAGLLRNAGYQVKSQCVQDVPGLQAALARGPWDLVVSEHAPPGLVAESVLELITQSGAAAPLIVFARTINEPDAAKAIAAGARDVVTKNQPARLVAVVARELRTGTDRAQARSMAQAFEELQRRHRAMLEGAREAIGYCHDGMHVDANEAYARLFGYAGRTELEGVPVLNLIDATDHRRFKDFLRGTPNAGPAEFQARRNDGSRFPIEAAWSTVEINGEHCQQITITELSRQSSREPSGQQDTLTGLLQQPSFLALLDQAPGAESHRALIYLRLDGLTEVYRALGPAAGDRYLAGAAKAFVASLPQGAVAARVGAAEFAALLTGQAAVPADNVAEILRAKLAALRFPADPPHPYAAQISATPGDDGLGATALLARAQAACLGQDRRAAPAAGAGSDAADEGWRRRIAAALGSEGLRLVFQPIVNMHGEPGEYYDVLVHMQDEAGAVGGAELLAAAGRTGQRAEIDRWLVSHALETLKEYHQQDKPVTFFVSLSRGACADEGLLPVIQQNLWGNGVAAEHLVFQIDEPCLGSHPEKAVAFLRALAAMNCRVGLDNFGTGFGGLEALHRQPIEFVRLDASLTRDIARDDVKQFLVNAVMQIARGLQKKTIAKEIEDPGSLSMLWNYGLDYAQGDYLQQPTGDANYNFSDDTTLEGDYATPQWLRHN